MSGWRGVLISGAVLYLAVAAQQALSKWSLLGAHPDLVLLSLSVLCLFADRRGGAVLGFFSGFLFGAASGADLWQLVVSRTLCGFLMAWVAISGIERSFLAAAILGAAGVLLARLTFMFLAPPPQILPFVEDTIRTAVYNGVLAILLYAALNRILGPRR